MTFRNAYVDLLNSARTARDGVFSTVLVPDVEHKLWTSKRRDVAIAAGAAGVPFARHGSNYTLRNAAWLISDVDPVTNWEMSLRDPEQLSPEMVIASVEAAIGRAEQEARETALRERGLTGIIATFIRWPANLREAVGPGNSAQRTAAGAIGMLGQLIVATLATALGAAIVAGVARAWSLLV